MTMTSRSPELTSFIAFFMMVSSLEILPEAQTIPVAILDIEIAAAVELIAQIADDVHALGLEFGVQWSAFSTWT